MNVSDLFFISHQSDFRQTASPHRGELDELSELDLPLDYFLKSFSLYNDWLVALQLVSYQSTS